MNSIHPEGVARKSRRTSLRLEWLEPRLLLDAADFGVDAEWICYQDNTNREVSWNFSGGETGVGGTVAIPDSAVLGHAPGEADASFALTPGDRNQTITLSGGAYNLSIPRAVAELTPIPRADIVVDGSPTDWDSVPIYCQDADNDVLPTAPPGSDIDYLKLAYSTDRSRLNFLFKLNGDANPWVNLRLYLEKNWSSTEQYGGDCIFDVYHDNDNGTDTWHTFAYGYSREGNFYQINADETIRVAGEYVEGSVSAKAFGLPAETDVYGWSLIAGVGNLDFYSNNLLKTEGLVRLTGESDGAVPSEWSYAARFKDFANTGRTGMAYSTSLGTSTMQWGQDATYPAIGAAWYTGTYKGVFYDNALVLSAGLESDVPNGQDYEWEWGPATGDGLVLEGLDPAFDTLDLKVGVTDGGRTATFYYRVNSPAADQNGADWQLLVAKHLPAAVASMTGPTETFPTIRLQTELDVSQLQSQPDLVGQFGAITLPERAVPGDTGKVPVIVTNDGWSPASGDLTIKLYSSSDQTLSSDDILLGESTQALNLAGGKSKTISFDVAIPSNAVPGSYYLLADIDPQDVIGESNDNNLLVGEAPRSVAWRFGAFGGRKSVKLALMDGGTSVTFALKGSGYGEVVSTPNGWDVFFEDTLLSSSAAVSTKSGGTARFHDVTVNGSLNSLVGKTADLSGDLTVTGTLKTLQLDDVAGGRRIAIGLPQSVRDTVTLTFDQVADLAIDSKTPIKSLTAARWLDMDDVPDQISVPWIGTLNIKGDARNNVPGDFEADILTTGQDAKQCALNSLKVQGTVRNAVLSLSGAAKALTAARWENATLTGPSLGSLSLKGDKKMGLSGDLASASILLTGQDSKGYSLGKLTVAGWFDNSEVRATGGDINTVTVGAMRNSLLFAGVQESVTGLPGSSADFANPSTIKSVTIKGSLKDADGFSTINSNIAARDLGRVSMAYGNIHNGEVAWGLAADSIASLSVRDTDGVDTWRRLDDDADSFHEEDDWVRLF